MPNPFDQFDQKQKSGNPFDRFGAVSQQAPQVQSPSQSNPLSDAYRKAFLAGDTVTAHKIAVQARQQGVPIAPISDADIDQSVDQRFKQSVQDESAGQQALEGAGKSFVDTAQGLGQLVGLYDRGDVAESRRLGAPLMDTGAGMAGYIGGQLAQSALPFGAATKGVQAAGLAARAAPFVASGLSGLVFEGAQPVAGNESRATNAALGAALGAAGEGAPRLLAKAAKAAEPARTSIQRAAIDLAHQYGIPLHLSQVTNSRAAKVLGAITNPLPFSGAARAARKQQAAFNRAVSGQFGTPSSTLTDEVFSDAHKALGKAYDTLFSRNKVGMDAATWRDLGRVAAEADANLPPEQARIVKNQIARYVEAAGKNGGSIPGTLYQNIAQAVNKAQSGAATPGLGNLIGDVRRVMQGAAERSARPGDAEALKLLNQRYNSLKVAEKAVTKRVSGAGGDVQPASLWSLVNGKYGSTPAMRDLARLGQTVLKNQIPNSGTPERMLGYGLLSGFGLHDPGYTLHSVLPFIAGGSTVGRFMNSPAAAEIVPGLGSKALNLLSRGARPVPLAAPLLAPSTAAASNP